MLVLSGDGLVDIPGLAGFEDSPVVLSGALEPGRIEDSAAVRFGDPPEDFYDAVESR